MSAGSVHLGLQRPSPSLFVEWVVERPLLALTSVGPGNHRSRPPALDASYRI